MKLGLQIFLGLFSLVPLAFAVLGMANGAAGLDPGGSVAAAVDNQFRYLSGMYVVVTLLLWSIIPEIEKHFRTAAILCAALFIGGIGRVISQMAVGPGASFQVSGMFIELGSPLVLVWLWFVVKRAKG
ncbi:putative membrane protein [Hyphomonas neptunium ATCC 15444]|uniref:DUF4345 domain-containing protein n=2 Tax=Hyphomonas TaxID=85 RepID=A0A059G0P3_9PROT|nr:MULTISPECIES: DUF4345 domain-containing protein [Hyphomonas]ABI78159.1 putative membrane protein [Hyphomonas neptunium ATCC 15444]KCZ96234.1 hypothetical protein HHI_01105 [Hyphomonas hirschiana VP5]